MSRRLTEEETRKCLIAWRELKDEDAITLLIESNKGLIVYFVKKYLNSGISFEDLFSAGNEGLFRAINRYDYENYSMKAFSTYISRSINNMMINDVKKHNKHREVISLEAPIGKNKDGDDLRLEDILVTDDNQLVNEFISNMKIKVVREALLSLTKRERQIILLRYGLNDDEKKTLKEIADMFNCTKQTIANQERKALIKMRHPKNTRKLKEFAEDDD